MRGEEEKEKKEKNWYGRTNGWMDEGSTRGPQDIKSRDLHVFCV